jgi:SAM-dependent methyltransferase/alkylhydroperoxidase family enzyme
MSAQWRDVDHGWGRRAAEFATLSEPANLREYVWLQHRLGVGRGDRLLDIACGAGLAIELASLRGANCAGIDASPRLIAVARDRCPHADLRVGDMHSLPWPDASVDVVTSFRGIWGTNPAAVGEAARVLAPGGRLGLTVWGHLKRSSGAWALQPFRLASESKVAHQAEMVALGRPGVGQRLLAECGLVDIERVEVPFVWEFPDPQAYARALATTGPAYEAIESVGEDAFREHAIQTAQDRMREGLPLRAEIAVVGYLARKPPSAGHPSGFLAAAAPSAEAQRLFDDDVAEIGFVMNASRVWAHLPSVNEDLFALMKLAVDAAGLTIRQRGILVTACAAARGDSYCALMWGHRLAGEAGELTAATVLGGDQSVLHDADRTLARWARRVVTDPNSVTAADVQDLRRAGWTDRQVLAITVFVALRLAFSTVNDALGAQPDHALRDLVAESVRSAVTFGRPMASEGPERG